MNHKHDWSRWRLSHVRGRAEPESAEEERSCRLCGAVETRPRQKHIPDEMVQAAIREYMAEKGT